MKKLLSWPFLLYLRFFARRALRSHRPVVIGVAGAVGKSSMVQALYAILREKYSVRYTPGNSETGVPLGILGIPHGDYSLRNWITIAWRCPFIKNPLKKADYLIVEMGTDELKPPKNMEYLLTIVKPDIAIWLNVYPAHMGLFAEGLSKEEKKLPETEREQLIIQKIAEEDGKIITKSECRVGIYCRDNEPVRQEIEMKFKTQQNLPSEGGVQSTPRKTELELLSFGVAGDNDMSYGEYMVTLQGTLFEFVRKGEQVKIAFDKVLMPLEYREEFAAALLTAEKCGMSMPEAAAALQKNFVLPPGRSSMFQGIKDSIIIDSSYNASPAAVVSFLELVKELEERTGRPVVFLFGDMRELGEVERIEHLSIAQKILGIVDRVYCVGAATRTHVIPYLEEQGGDRIQDLRWFPHARALGEYVRETLPERALVLVKGSQNTIYLEEAIKYLLKNSADESRLCRQSEYWKKVKEEFFKKAR